MADAEVDTEGKRGIKKIERLEKGDTERTAMHADVINEIIDAVNNLMDMRVTPEGTGRFMYSDGNIVLSLNTEQCD